MNKLYEKIIAATVLAVVLGCLVVATVGSLVKEETVVVQGGDFSGISEQVANVRSTVVHVLKEGECQGSGCIISEDGYIFTAKHVTEGDPEKYVITLDDGTEYPVVWGIELRAHDIAVLKIIPNKPLPFAKLADVNEMKVGDLLFIMGSPFGKVNFNSVTLGILSSIYRDMNPVVEPYGISYGWTPTFQSDAAAFPGNSGGPVFNLKGEVVGALVGGMSPSLNYSVPVSAFMYNVETIRLWRELDKFDVLRKDPSWYMTEDEYYDYIGR